MIQKSGAYGGTSDLMEEEDSGTWLTTYADMMTLLLVFFIILYSMYFKDNEEFKASVSSIEISVDDDGDTVSLIEFVERAKGQDPIKLQPSTEKMKQSSFFNQETKDLLDTQKWGDDIFQVINGDKILVRMPGGVLFETGRAELKPEAYSLLDPFDVIFERYPDYKVNIQGHTDNVPINTVLFASNWELSAVRATTILRFFLDQGLDISRVTATGLADSVPIVLNDSPENRAINRRVEIVLEK